MNKKFNDYSFSKTSIEAYNEILENWILALIPLLKPTSTIYICGDWFSSTSIHMVGQKFFNTKNRITWTREKGRGAKTNWKNCHEDIWFFTNSDNFYFDVDSVKIKRTVVAPYKDSNGINKDWFEENGKNYRFTYPSNSWNDLVVPFWSMKENTEHPTQKPEKLMAKLILASTKEGDVVLDPFNGSGSTSTVAKKLNRFFIGIEKQEDYVKMALIRLKMSETDNSIQGFKNGIFEI